MITAKDIRNYVSQVVGFTGAIGFKETHEGYYVVIPGLEPGMRPEVSKRFTNWSFESGVYKFRLSKKDIDNEAITKGFFTK